MSADAMWQLQKAVYSRLTGDSALMALVNNNIYENVPEETAFPFVAISDLEAVTQEQTEKNLYAVNFFIDCITRERGSKKTLDIIKAAEDSLLGTSLSVTGYDVLNIRSANSACKRMNDGITYIGSLKIVSLLKQT